MRSTQATGHDDFGVEAGTSSKGVSGTRRGPQAGPGPRTGFQTRARGPIHPIYTPPPVALARPFSPLCPRSCIHDPATARPASSAANSADSATGVVTVPARLRPWLACCRGARGSRGSPGQQYPQAAAQGGPWRANTAPRTACGPPLLFGVNNAETKARGRAGSEAQPSPAQPRSAFAGGAALRGRPGWD